MKARVVFSLENMKAKVIFSLENIQKYILEFLLRLGEFSPIDVQQVNKIGNLILSFGNCVSSMNTLIPLISE